MSFFWEPQFEEKNGYFWEQNGRVTFKNKINTIDYFVKTCLSLRVYWAIVKLWMEIVNDISNGVIFSRI